MGGRVERFRNRFGKTAAKEAVFCPCADAGAYPVLCGQGCASSPVTRASARTRCLLTAPSRPAGGGFGPGASPDAPMDCAPRGLADDRATRHFVAPTRANPRRSVLRPESDDQWRGHPSVHIARQRFGFVQRPQHGVIPGFAGARLQQPFADDGAVGRQAHFDLGARGARDGVGVHDVWTDLGADLGAVAARGAWRAGAARGGAIVTPAGPAPSRQAPQIVLALPGQSLLLLLCLCLCFALGGLLGPELVLREFLLLFLFGQLLCALLGFFFLLQALAALRFLALA